MEHQKGCTVAYGSRAQSAICSATQRIRRFLRSLVLFEPIACVFFCVYYTLKILHLFAVFAFFFGGPPEAIDIYFGHSMTGIHHVQRVLKACDGRHSSAGCSAVICLFGVARRRACAFFSILFALLVLFLKRLFVSHRVRNRAK